jgi:hypothetical protein
MVKDGRIGRLSRNKHGREKDEVDKHNAGVGVGGGVLEACK